MSRRRYREEEDEGIFDLYTVIRYVALSILFAVIIFGTRTIVQMATAASPTGQVGNGMLTLYEVHNTGAAFNLFQGQPEMLIIASFLVIAVMAFIVIMMSTKLTQTAISAMALLTAGIAMNMSERVQYGYVIDYIDCNFLPSFPVFNTADIMIVCGAIGLIMAILTRR